MLLLGLPHYKPHICNSLCFVFSSVTFTATFDDGRAISWTVPGSLGHCLEKSYLRIKNTCFEIFWSRRETLTILVTVAWGFFCYSSKNYPNIMLNFFLLIYWVSPCSWRLGSCAVLTSCPLGLRALSSPPSWVTWALMPLISMLSLHLACWEPLPLDFLITGVGYLGTCDSFMFVPFLFRFSALSHYL